ncbi:MAG: hypothetical protein EA396_10525 [Anaerolineaceae bacterium]|nr:MAG: hypothetical protein EA396_10525 [Anaerolineaceae bacterium]
MLYNKKKRLDKTPMTYQTLKMGISAIKAGNMREGGRLVRIAIQSEDLTDAQRASGWVWLAHTMNEPQKRIRCYEEALRLEPDNQFAQERLRELKPPAPPPPPDNLPAPPADLPTGKPATPPPPQTLPGTNTMPAPRALSPEAQKQQPIESLSAQKSPYSPPPQRRTTWKQSEPVDPARETQTATAVPVNYNNYTQANTPPPNNNASRGGVHYRTVGIIGGPEGDATGFFMSKGGLVVTTRHAIGGSLYVNYALSDGTVERAQVVRSWPEYDVALLHTGRPVEQLIPMANTPDIPDNMPLKAVAHGGFVVEGVKRATRTDFGHWFPTTIDSMRDAGGNPVFNDQGLLVGMLTANANPSAPYVFGLHSIFIRNLVREYKAHMENYERGMAYCSACGHISNAGVYGGFYCEHCGTVLPHAVESERFNLPTMAPLYGESMNSPCPRCESTSGFYKGACLRCGHRV